MTEPRPIVIKIGEKVFTRTGLLVTTIICLTLVFFGGWAFADDESFRGILLTGVGLGIMPSWWIILGAVTDHQWHLGWMTGFDESMRGFKAHAERLIGLDTTRGYDD